jgi:sialate O-acetylesterase
MKKYILFVLATCLALLPLHAVEMCWIFGNNMVLQADRPLPVWGQGQPGEEVTVSFAGQEKKATAGEDGEWRVVLDPMPANVESQTMKISAPSGGKEFTDVLLGDVWLASGQSNMAQPGAEKSEGGDQLASQPANPLLRVFPVAYNEWAPEPNTRQFAWERKVTNWFDWKLANPGTSGVPYWFGSMLQKETGRPIGVIISPVGASNAECWIAMKDLEADPYFKDIVENSKNRIANVDAEREKLKEEVAAWGERKKAAQEAGKPFTERQPHDQRDEVAARWWVGSLYNARIAPLRDLAIKGVIWYQGENNAGKRGVNASSLEGYDRLMKNIIASWRKQFGQPDLPFHTVQLSFFNWNDGNGRTPRDPNKPGSWTIIREAQEKTANETPNSEMVVSWDIGTKENIHPANKRPVGERLAKVALRDTYGKKDVIADSPSYASHMVEGDKIRVTFKNTHGGLKTKGEKVLGFAIAGADNNFVWAEAAIDGRDDVLVWSPQVSQPTNVRFGYIQFQDSDLYNKADLPLVPFRTDSLPLEQNKDSEPDAPQP